jgi:predicted permease
VILALSSHGYWTIALLIGLAAALVVAALLAALLLNVARIQRSVESLLAIAGKVGANTANIPQLEATAPVLAQIVDEAVVQDGYMNALTDGFGGETGAVAEKEPA